DNKLSMGTGTGIMIASSRIDGSTVTGNTITGSGGHAIYVASPPKPNAGKHVIHGNTVTGYPAGLFIDLKLHPGADPGRAHFIPLLILAELEGGSHHPNPPSCAWSGCSPWPRRASAATAPRGAASPGSPPRARPAFGSRPRGTTRPGTSAGRSRCPSGPGCSPPTSSRRSAGSRCSSAP